MKKRHLFLSSMILLCLNATPLFLQAATPTTYYVDANLGSDSNDGHTAPWKTIAKVNDYDNNTGFTPGDTISFKRGQVWRETLYPVSDGAVGNPITYNAYGPAGLNLPVINGADIITGWTAVTFTANVYQATPIGDGIPYVFVNGVTSTAVADASLLTSNYQWFQDNNNAPYYIYIYSTSNPNIPATRVEYANRNNCINTGNNNLVFDSLALCMSRYQLVYSAGISKIQNCHFYLGGGGVTLNGIICNNNLENCGWGFDVGSNCLVTGNTACSTTDAGIYANGSNNTITANYCHDNSAAIEVHGNGNIVNNNLCRHCENGGTGIWVTDAFYSVITGNEVDDCDWGISLGDGPCTNMLVYANRVHGDATCGFEHINALSANNHFYDNLVYGNSDGFLIADPAVGTIIENNVVYNNINGVQPEGDAAGYVFRNNIFSSNTGYDFNYSGTLPATDHQNNCYFRPASLIGDSVHVNLTNTAQDLYYLPADITTFEPTAFNSDPIFTAQAAVPPDFHLLPSSPYVGAGTTAGIYPFDYDGNPVPLGTIGSGVAIGAFQYLLTPHMKSDMTWTNVPIKTLQVGSWGNIVGQIQCSAYLYDTLVSMTVTNSGTAVSGSDLAALHLLFAPDGNTLTAALVGTFTPIDAKNWSITGLSHQALDKGSYFLSADIAVGATLSRVCQFLLGAKQAYFKSARYLPPATLANVDNQIINNIIFNNSDIAVDLASSPTVRVVKGEKQVSLGQVSLANLTQTDIPLSTLRLGVRTPAGATLDAGTVLTSLQLRQNNAVVCSLASPFSQGLLFSLPAGLTLSAQAAGVFQIQGDISSAPTADKFSLAVLDNTCVNAGQPLSQAAAGKAFPMVTNPISIRDPQLAATFSNYPNPFQPSQGTKIGYYLPNDAQIKLALWTLDHRLVKTLVNEKQSTGMVEITWDGRNGAGNFVRNGVYLLALDCTYSAGGHETYTRKIAVAK